MLPEFDPNAPLLEIEHPMQFYVVMLLWQKQGMSGVFNHKDWREINGCKSTSWRVTMPIDDGSIYTVVLTEKPDTGVKDDSIFYHQFAYNHPKDGTPVYRVTKLEKDWLTLELEEGLNKRDKYVTRSNNKYFAKQALKKTRRLKAVRKSKNNA